MVWDRFQEKLWQASSEPDPCFRMLPALFFLFQTSIFSLVVSIERCAAQQIVCCQLSLHPGVWMSHRLGLCNVWPSGLWRVSIPQSIQWCNRVLSTCQHLPLSSYGRGYIYKTMNCRVLCWSGRVYRVLFFVTVWCFELGPTQNLGVLARGRRVGCLVGHNWHVQERGPTQNTRLNNSPPKSTL